MNQTKADLLALLRDGRVTPRYAADELDKQQPYISQLLAQLVDDDLARKVDRGLYEITPDGEREVDGRDGEDVDDVEDAGGEDVPASGGRDPSPAPRDRADGVDTGSDDRGGEDNPATEDRLGGAVDAGAANEVPVGETPREYELMADALVEEIDMPGRGSRLDARRETVKEMYLHVLREGEATKEELKAYVDPDAVGYDSAENFFANVVRGGSGAKYAPVFDQLPGVERPGQGGQSYRRVPK